MATQHTSYVSKQSDEVFKRCNKGPFTSCDVWPGRSNSPPKYWNSRIRSDKFRNRTVITRRQQTAEWSGAIGKCNFLLKLRNSVQKRPSEHWNNLKKMNTTFLEAAKNEVSTILFCMRQRRSPSQQLNNYLNDAINTFWSLLFQSQAVPWQMTVHVWDTSGVLWYNDTLNVPVPVKHFNGKNWTSKVALTNL